MRDRSSPQFSEPPALDSSKDRTRELEQVIDRRIEELLIHNSSLVNEGNNGFIFRLELEHIDHAARQNLETLGISLPPEGEKFDNAIKVLKVYGHGGGRREFDLQKKSHELVECVPKGDKHKYAQIPKPEIYRELTLSAQAKTELERNKVNILGDKVELIFMEFVHGDDLATSFDRWVIEHPTAGNNEFAGIAQSKDFQQLHRAVSHILGFAQPERKQSPREEALSQRKVYNENAQRLYRYLEKTGYELDPAILEQIKNTLELLRANGIEHPDPHERNFMIADKNGVSQAYAVDFGMKADSLDEQALEFDPIKLLERLAVPRESRKKQEQSEKKQTFAEERKKITALGASGKVLEETAKIRRISTTTKKAMPEIIINTTADLTRNEESLREFMAILFTFMKSGEINQDQAREILYTVQESTVKRKRDGKLDKISNPFAYNRLGDYKSLLAGQEKTPADSRKTGNRQESKPAIKRINQSKPPATRSK